MLQIQTIMFNIMKIRFIPLTINIESQLKAKSLMEIESFAGMENSISNLKTL